MPGFFGTEEQRNLQARAEASVAAIAATPGLCQNCRMLGCDDIDRLGWKTIVDILQRDGFIGFRLIRVEENDQVQANLAERGFRLDTWNLYIGAREEVLPLCEQIVNTADTGGLVALPMPRQPEDAYTLCVQQLIASTGVVPFSGSFLTGECGAAATVVVGTDAGHPVAAAHAYLPHNSHSPYLRYAWGGLVAVEAAYRGKGLGSYINARLAVAIFNDLNASHMYEMIASTNAPSQKMAEACGLKFASMFMCGVATHADRGRFTR